jgi:hypothetical protein
MASLLRGTGNSRFVAILRCMARLHWAAKRGFLPDVDEAISSGDPVDARTAGDETPLHLAAQEGWTQVVERLLQAGADPRLVDRNGRTALHLAASRGHHEVVRYLVAHGAEVDPRDRSGCTPALDAALFNNRETADFLLTRGADPQVAGRDGRTVAEWLRVGGVMGLQVAATEQPPEVREFELQMIRSFMAECSSPEEYAAIHGRNFLLFSFGTFDLPDPEADRWAKRLKDTLVSPDLLADCEDRFLSGDALAEAQRQRACRAKADERRRRRDELREKRRTG